MQTAKLSYNVTEAAEALSISRQSLYKLMREDRSFPVFHIGKSVRISAEGLQEWVRRQTEVCAS